ncbi:hypothetical protein D9M72_442060 [compost metagenome]
MGSLSSGVRLSQATSKPSGSSACRHATRVVVLPQPAGPCSTTPRRRRPSISRASNASRATARPALRGGTILVATRALSPEASGEREGESGLFCMSLAGIVARPPPDLGSGVKGVRRPESLQDKETP